MKDREIICEYYICKGQCAKNKDASFYGLCQHCQSYKPTRGRQPKRTDNRRKKLDKIQKNETWD